MKVSIFSAATAALAALILSSSGLAAVISTGSITIPDSGSAADPSGITFPVPAFNPSLGTLTGVSLDFSSNLLAQLDVFDFSPTPGPFTNGFSNGTVTLAGPDGTDASGMPSVGTPAGGMSTDVSGTASNPFGYSDFPGSALPLSDTVNVPVGNLSDYVGAGNANFTVSYSTSTSGGVSTNAGQDFFGGELFATGGTVDATYTYTPVPEPTCLAILGAPLVALLARRRKA